MGLIDLMRRYNIPITREKCTWNRFDLGDPPAALSAEEEANLPPMLAKNEMRS